MELNEKKFHLRKEVSFMLLLSACMLLRLHPVANMMFLTISLFFVFAMTARFTVAEHVSRSMVKGTAKNHRAP